MAGRTPREAVEAFLEPFQQVVSCVTDEGFVARIRRPGGPYPATFQSGFAILDRAGDRLPLQLTLVHSYEVVPVDGDRRPWRARTAGWIYRIADAAEAPILAFHWHPENSGRVTRPHLHAYGLHRSVELQRLHPPTGRVSIESVVRFLIEDLDVIPRRPDWDRILEQQEQAFRQSRTWS